MAAPAPAASCMGTEHGCVMFDCLIHLWEWLDPPIPQTQYQMENKNTAPATQQPLTQQHLMAHHVHPEQIYTQNHSQMTSHLNSTEANQIQPNGVMHQLLQSQYHSNMNARSPLLENRHEHYGTGRNQDYARHYGANDNYNYPQAPPRRDIEVHTDHNVNHELLQNMPKGYNAEVYQDYLKRNPPKDTNQIYQNHQAMYRPNASQYGSKPYLPYSNRIGPQSNTELLRRQYNELQQMKLQQQLHYQNQAQMHQQQKFAERQLLLQQIHGVQPPPNLQNSIYSDNSFRDLDRYSSKQDFKEYSNSDLQKEIDRYSKCNDHKETEMQHRHYQESQWQANQQNDFRDQERCRRQSEGDRGEKSQSLPDYGNQKHVGVISPMKSSESSTPSVKSPSSDSRRSSSGNQALRSPIAQRIPSAPVTMSGILYKQGSDGLKVWRKRWFVLSEYCLFYYKSQDEEKLLGSVLLPSYKVSACTPEDKVLRKHSFKLEHTNMRTYILAASDQETMMKWVKALTMAALMQNPNEQMQKQNDRSAKIEEDDDIPTYANAPPKPRRSNEGYNSPSPDMYDPNYDLLKKPASHYSQGQGHIRYQENTNYQNNLNQETYTRSPQSPPTQTQYPKRLYDTHQLSLPLSNTITDKLENQPGTSNNYRSNPQSPYFDRTRGQHQNIDENKDQIYDRQSQRNPFLQDSSPQIEMMSKDPDSQSKHSRSNMEEDKRNHHLNETKADHFKNDPVYNKEIYGECDSRTNRAGTANEQLLIDRRTPEAYGRSKAMSNYNKDKLSDYEDVYGNYGHENDYGKTLAKSPNPPQSRQHVVQQNSGNYPQEKTFSGPSVLRRKKMQSSGIQPPMPRPHSADFLEYESKNEVLNKLPARPVEPTKQPQRPKSSLDINSYYDPNSDRYYSEESYAEKMRQSAQYLHQGLGPRHIDIPLAKYASGLAKKQLSSAYSQINNNNYETEFSTNRNNRDNISFNSKNEDSEGLNSNWTLKEKNLDNQKESLNRSGSVMSDSSHISNVKDISRYDPTGDSFIRSASARLPSAVDEKEGDKKVQQREESMKRLLEWKQRMLQSPLTRKSTPATISLARSLNQSRQSLRSDKGKTFTNVSYNSYSSDDEEESPGTDLQKPSEMQAGRSIKGNLANPIVIRPLIPHASCATHNIVTNLSNDNREMNDENTYENVSSTLPILKATSIEKDLNIEEPLSSNNCKDEEIPENDVATNCTADGNNHESCDSEAESENQAEYTDYDLDEVLLESDTEDQIENKISVNESEIDKSNCFIESLQESDNTPSTPTTSKLTGEDHYLPMSPRKMSIIDLAHQNILQNLSIFDETLPQGFEDNPYVEMNINNEDEDMETYEIVCVDNGKMEPVYMELSSVAKRSEDCDDISVNLKSTDNISNFADTKEQTLKRASKREKSYKEKSDCSDADDEASKDMSMETPFSRFSISDTFRPASYYLSNSSTVLDIPDSSNSDIYAPLSSSNCNPCDKLSGEALSKYVLDKLDKSNMSQDNSILKMLTTESQNMNSVKRKATSLMIYGSKTSIHDTLSRGEKIRNSRASLISDRNRVNSRSIASLNNSASDNFNPSDSIESDSLKSYSADRGSSRQSLESDVSSKFDIALSNISSEVASLNESEFNTDFRKPSSLNNTEMMMKRRPVSDNSLFDLVASSFPLPIDSSINVDLDRYLDNLQPESSSQNRNSLDNFVRSSEISKLKDNTFQAVLQSAAHSRCSSTPVTRNTKSNEIKFTAGPRFRKIGEHSSGHTGSQSSFGSMEVTKSPISYYCKSYDEETSINKNLNNGFKSDKVKEFERVKHSLRVQEQPSTSSASTGIHSRESSTEQSAPYYYSDLSSQEHINSIPTSHYLKNTNLHRKLNNQRRRGPSSKKNEISHIHNPIKNNHSSTTDPTFELVASARSVSVEFLSAAGKDSEIDLKNIYESTGGKHSKISESMSLISGLGCKRLSSNINNVDNSSIQSNSGNSNTLIKLSSTSMSSHCSGNSSNTVYYDAETETSTYENICVGEKHWDEDNIWRDNLRRVSHRHARSMDDLDTMITEAIPVNKTCVHDCGMNSIKRLKKSTPNKINRNVTYVNCDFKGRVHQGRESHLNLSINLLEEEQKPDENDVYVSLAKETDSLLKSDEGVYEQLSIECPSNSVSLNVLQNKMYGDDRHKKKFEIDREKLRQWDLMSSGLMKGLTGRVRDSGMGSGAGELACSTDTGTDSASNEASMSLSGVNTETSTNNNTINQQALSKKAFLGSNTSIGRNNRDANIPVRAVSPRVRWVEEKPSNEYGSQQISTSQHNLHTLATEETWSSARSPIRSSQQPIRAVSPRVRRNTQNEDIPRGKQKDIIEQLGEVPSAGELLGHTHEELVLLLIQLRRRHAATHRAIEQCCTQICSIEDSLSSLKAIEREENLRRLEQLKIQLMELENQYEKSKPLVQLVDNMVKLGSLYNRPGSTVERLERNQRLRQKVLAEHALEQQRWLESVAAGKPLETEAARARVAELWALEQELADEAAILQGLKSDKDTIENLLSGVRKMDGIRQDIRVDHETLRQRPAPSGLEAELARVHAMLAHNSKKLEQTVADNARLERELQQLRRALQARRAAAPTHPTAVLEDEVSRVQHLVSALQRQRQELSRAVRHLTQQSQALQTTHDSMPGKHRPMSSWQETNLDTGHTIDHGHTEYEYEMAVLHPGHANVETPLYVDTRAPGVEVTSPLTSEETPSGFVNLSNVEKQEIKTVRIVKRESERRQRDRERSLQPLSDWPSNNITANLDQFLEEELVQPLNYSRASSLSRTDYSKYENYYTKQPEPPNYLRLNEKNMELSPKYVSSPSLSNYDYSRDISSLSSSYNKSYDRNMSISNQYLNSPTDSSRTLTNDPISKTSSIISLTRSNIELSPIFKSEAAKQIITEMSGDVPKNGSLHRRQVPKEKRRHYTAPHHLSAKTLDEIPKDGFNQDKMSRSVDDADMERALRGGVAPDVVRSALPPQKLRLADNTIEQLFAAPQKILIPERYIPEKPPELSPEEQQKRQEKVESIKKMLTGTSADPSKSPDADEKRQREHLLQMNQILAKQVTEMSKIIAVKALEELPQNEINDDLDDLSPDVELPIYQQRDNYFT